MDDFDVRARAAQQHGLIARNQLTAVGCSEMAIRHQVRHGDLERLSHEVYRVRGSAPTLQQRRMAAVLHAGHGAALSHASASSSWGFGRRSSAIEVLRPRRGNAPPAVFGRVHEVRDLLDHHVVIRDGIPTTTPARTVVDLAAREHPSTTARMIDTAWSRRLLNIGALASVVAEVRGRGRRGVRLLDELIGDRQDVARPGSALEVRFERITSRAGLPPLRRQVHLYDDEGWIGCVDFVVEGLPLVLFVDGAVFHSSLTDQRHDDAQTRRLEAAGYHVERFGDAQILFDEPYVERTAHAAFVLARESVPIGTDSRAKTMRGDAA